MGYILIPKNIYKIACAIVGIPNTGKSVIAEAVRTMFKGYDASLSLQDLANTWFPAELEDKIVNIRSEITSQGMKQWETFKSLASVDRIQAQRKFGQPFMMENKAKFIFTSNALPPVTNQEGVYDRFLVLVARHNYKTSSDDDPYIELGKEDELSGMLRFAVDGYHILKEHKGFYPKIDVMETKIAYNAWTGDAVTKFINTCITVDLEYTIPKDIVYKEYCNFCLLEGEISLAENAFWRSMKDRIKFTDGQISASKDPHRPTAIKGFRLNE
jgi:putative DNA primase/helicase